MLFCSEVRKMLCVEDEGVDEEAIRTENKNIRREIYVL